MAIKKCSHCKKDYWKYPVALQPAGYCSLNCWDARKKKKRTAQPAELPLSAIHAMLAHRTKDHNTTSLIEVFECPQCEALEARYAEALHYAVKKHTTEETAA